MGGMGRIKEKVMFALLGQYGLKSQPKAASFNLGPFYSKEGWLHCVPMSYYSSTLRALSTVRKKILMVNIITLLDLCATTLGFGLQGPKCNLEERFL